MELTTQSSTSTDPLEQIVEQMFSDMLLAYGKKFGDMWKGSSVDALIQFWTRGLRGYTPREIRRGIEALETRPWPPTLPEFKLMCRPPVDDMKSYYEALAGLEARGKGEAGTWSHPAIYWAASLLRLELMSQTHAQIKDRWTALLKSQLEHGEWAEIPAPRVMLPPPEQSPNARENAKKMIAQLGASGVIKAHAGHDPRAWAKKILARQANGDKTLSMIQIQFATEAMAAPL